MDEKSYQLNLIRLEVVTIQEFLTLFSEYNDMEEECKPVFKHLNNIMDDLDTLDKLEAKHNE